MRRGWTLFAALAAGLASVGLCNKFAGSFTKPRRTLEFIGMYAFGVDPSGKPVGTVEMNVTTESSDLVIYLFDDQLSSWPAVQAEDMTCEAASKQSPDGAARYRASVNVAQGASGFSWSESIEDKLRPRFWYAVLASRTCQSLVSASDYAFEFRQADGSQLSYDETGLPTFRLIMLFVWGAMTALHVAVTYAYSPWKPAQLRWLTVPMAMEVLAQTLLTAHWMTKEGNGVGSPGSEAVSRGLHELALMAVWSILVATSGGTGVVRRQLFGSDNLTSMVGLLATLGIFVMELVLVLWYELARDPSSTEFIFDSGAGITVVVLQTGLGLWFLVTARWIFFASSDPDMRDWVKRLAVVGMPAFLVLPIAAIVGAATPAYDRLNVVEIVMASFYAAVVSVIMLLFQPRLWGEPLGKFYRPEGSLAATVDPEGLSDSALAMLREHPMPSGAQADALLEGREYAELEDA